jgi:hypothetical protein
MSRHPTALERLNAFIGEWSVEASFAQPAATGHAVFEWALGNQFLVERAEVIGAPDSIGIVGLGSDSQALTQHYFDSRGVARV